jgi:hypothetical protein
MRRAGKPLIRLCHTLECLTKAPVRLQLHPELRRHLEEAREPPERQFSLHLEAHLSPERVLSGGRLEREQVRSGRDAVHADVGREVREP